ncbi:hypothetical protein ACGVWS_13660 [Enterobacteriaceae bacterium LUAb1]
MKKIDATEKISCISLSLLRQQRESGKPAQTKHRKKNSGIFTDALQALQRLPDTDETRILTIKTALSRKGISIDTNALAKAMLEWHCAQKY